MNQVLELDGNAKANAARYDGLQKWAEQLSNLHNSISAKIVV